MLWTITSTTHAQQVTTEEAFTVAENWINIIINRYGSWGNYPEAEVVLVYEFTRNENPLAYYCQVAPQGFIIVSLYKCLDPVKAYSETTTLNPFIDQGLTDLIKLKIERVHSIIQQEFGVDPHLLQGQQITQIFESDPRAAWDALINPRFAASVYQLLEYSASGCDYQEGQVLLNSSWHQRPPYNNDCPADGCDWPNYGNFNTRTRVGCVATAGAQIMRYWCWPPYGSGNPYSDTYDWPNMHLQYNYDFAGWFNDQNGNTVTWTDIDAVAELNHEVGIAVGMSWGCDSSGADTSDMEDVYEDHYRYASYCDKIDRDNYTPANWFNTLKIDLNQNQPIQYRVEGHSIVADGWREIFINSVFTRQYHMNYGWDSGENTWWTLDTLLHGGESDEYVIRKICPNVALGPNLSGTYGRNVDFGYRYFNRDASGSDVVFTQGQHLQVLKPLLTITGNGENGVKLLGSSGYTTRIFIGDDENGTDRINIYDGAIKLHSGGQIMFK
ncbi:MAG: hypothetical protein GY869_31260 [Planctomycetes bacterium]|nr:hypothetical protein [Planctomycetota bacterium]